EGEGQAVSASIKNGVNVSERLLYSFKIPFIGEVVSSMLGIGKGSASGRNERVRDPSRLWNISR
ncbi:hypothetical protein K435DRAFT_778522, partial [Dendrothele bispora CBS 962.96]